MLHLINTSTDLDTLLARFAKGDSLLFMAEAVLCLHAKARASQLLLAYQADFQCYVLEADLLARGLLVEELLPMLSVVDYAGFVKLTIDNTVIKTWS